MKTLQVLASAAVPLLLSGAASAQSGSVMNGGMGNTGWMGGYGGYWMPVLLFVVVRAGLRSLHDHQPDWNST